MAQSYPVAMSPPVLGDRKMSLTELEKAFYVIKQHEEKIKQLEESLESLQRKYKQINETNTMLNRDIATLEQALVEANQ